MTRWIPFTAVCLLPAIFFGPQALRPVLEAVFLLLVGFLVGIGMRRNK